MHFRRRPQRQPLTVKVAQIKMKRPDGKLVNTGVWYAEFSEDLLTDGAKPFRLKKHPIGGYRYRRPAQGHTPLLSALINQMSGKLNSANLLIVQKNTLQFYDAPHLHGKRGPLWIKYSIIRAAHKAGYSVSFEK